MAIGGILNQEIDTEGFATKDELKQEINKVNQSLGTLPGVLKLVGSFVHKFTGLNAKYNFSDYLSQEVMETLYNCKSFYVKTEFVSDIEIKDEPGTTTHIYLGGVPIYTFFDTKVGIIPKDKANAIGGKFTAFFLKRGNTFNLSSSVGIGDVYGSTSFRTIYTQSNTDISYEPNTSKNKYQGIQFYNETKNSTIICDMRFSVYVIE